MFLEKKVEVLEKKIIFKLRFPKEQRKESENGIIESTSMGHQKGAVAGKIRGSFRRTGWEIPNEFAKRIFIAVVDENFIETAEEYQ